MDVSKVARQDLIACIDLHEFMAKWLRGLNNGVSEAHTAIANKCRAELNEMEVENAGE